MDLYYTKQGELMGWIYILTSPVGKSYVGQTVRKWNERLRRHLLDVEKGSMLAIHRAIRKYGIENFQVALYEFPDEELDEKEKEFIRILNTMAPNGYNMTPGGDGVGSGKDNPMYGKKHSAEAKEKMSENHSHWCKGKIPPGVKRRNYLVTTPEGMIVIETDNLRELCRVYGLEQSAMVKVAKGKQLYHKGYKCEYV